MKIDIRILMVITMFSMATSAMAYDEIRKTDGRHMHGPLHGGGKVFTAHRMDSMAGRLFEKRIVDGYTLSFHIMKAEPGHHIGGPDNLMVRVEKGGEAMINLVLHSMVKHPDGRTIHDKMRKVGNWYLVGDGFEQVGQYQLRVQFETPDGAEHVAQLAYSASSGL
ncbi:MAG: hypothetical protein Q9M31_02995 [Mariprofundus sp.]|nr:hypothetical protein [Mariprofundus sp.]